MNLYVEIRTTGGDVIQDDTFPLIDSEWEKRDIGHTFRRALVTLYTRQYPRIGGWQIGTAQHFPGGNTYHVQMTAGGRKRNPTSLEPLIVARYTEVDE